MIQDTMIQEDQNSADINPDAEILQKNLALDLSEDKLTEISTQVKRGFETDLQSRSEWDVDMDKWVELANQMRTAKTFPWQGASNVKYPLIATAAMQFSARAYPSLIPSNGQLVKTVVIGKDPDGQKFEKADRVSKYMSYQILHEMDGWEEDMDKMLMMLSVVGTIFKKTYFDKHKDQVVSRFVHPKNLVVNYWTNCLEDAERISEVIEMSQRLVKERQLNKVYRDIDLGQPSTVRMDNSDMAQDETTPYELVEQHTFLDLKDTKYPLPYIVTFEKNSGKILRIIPRFNPKDITLDGKKIIKAKPIQMYTKFGFVPNPNGSFYDMGFGTLLGPLNESVNTLINQLIDSGSLNNLQSGFIGKGVRLKMGDTKFQLGEWKPVQVAADDLRKQILPLPTKEPSNVLFQLMGSLITSGKELASVAEIFVGKMPGQNTPATTTMASIEQGMKVFTAVYKRIFRSLAEEFEKIYELNGQYLDPNKYIQVLDMEVGPEDFDKESYDICPGADPTAVSQTEKLLKAQGLMELLGAVPGILDPIQVYSRMLEAQEQPNWQQLFSQAVQQTGQVPPPPPDPKLLAIKAKAQADQAKTAMDLQAKQQEMELDARDSEMQMAMQQQEHAQKMEHEIQSTQVKAASEVAMSRIYEAQAASKAQQGLQQSDAKHKQKITQQKEAQKSKPANTQKKN